MVTAAVSRAGAPLNLKRAGTLSAGMRLLLLGGKFLFMVALARLTTPATVGLYTLAVTVSTVLVYLVGAELHTYTTREIVGLPSNEDRASHMQSHLRVVLVGVLLSLPLAWGVLYWLRIESQLSFALFTLVLLGEVLCQELARYLIVLGHAVASNFLQLLRAAGWMPVAAWWLRDTDYRAVDVMLACWAMGCVVAAVFGLWQLRALFTRLCGFSWQWLRQAMGSARHYFVVALLTQVQSYADRVIIQRYMGEHSVGLLAFYQSFASTLQAFVQAGVISILLPRLLLSVQQQDRAGSWAIRRRMYRAGVGTALVLAVVLWVGMGPVLSLVGRDEYRAVLGLFPWLLLGNVLLIAGQVPHLHLYAQRQDRLLMRLSLLLVPLAVAANLVVVPLYGLNGAVAVFVLSALVQALLKGWYSHRSSLNRSADHAT